MAEFTRRVGLGRPLTYEEADENFEFVEEQADRSVDAADLAQQTVSEAVNFAGRWEGLSGAQVAGITTYYDGSYWLLLNDVSNVSASEPGVSADWALTRTDEVIPEAGIPVSTGTGWGASKTSPSGDLVGTSDSQLLTNKTIGAGVSEAVLDAGTAIEIDGDSEPWRQSTLTANRTVTISLPVGVSRSLWINPGTYTVTWPSGTHWKDGAAPDLPASKWTLITFTGTPINSAGIGAVIWSQE